MRKRISSNDYEAAASVQKPTERSGHIAIMWAGFMFVIGGYGEVNKGSNFKPLTEVWYYNPFRKLWKSITAKGISPDNAACSGACAKVLGDDIYLFGGFYRNVGHSDKLIRLSLINARGEFEPEWSDITDEVEGNGPTKKDKFCSWTYGENSVMFFGGFGPPAPNSPLSGDFTFEEFPNVITCGYGWNNHLHKLTRQLDDNKAWRYTWSQPKYTGDVPSPRAAASTATVGDTVWMFGGRYKTKRLSDLHAFDLETFAWRQVAVSDCGPVGRSWHAMAPVGDRNFVLHGGYDNKGNVLHDTWLYDTLHDTWTTIVRPSNPLSLPRLWHTCNGLSDSEVLFFGGCEASVMEKNAKHLNSVLTLKMSPSPLQSLCADLIRKYAFSEKEIKCNLSPSVRHQFSLETPRHVGGKKSRQPTRRQSVIQRLRYSATRVFRRFKQKSEGT